MEDLNVFIHGHGLDSNGQVHFNLTRSSLKGEALRVFNDKAAEQEEDQKETKDILYILNVSVLSQNICPPRTIRSSNRKPICTTTCSCIWVNDRSVSFVPGGMKSTTISTNSHHFHPTSTFWMKNQRHPLYHYSEALAVLLATWQVWHHWMFHITEARFLILTKFCLKSIEFSVFSVLAS
jgi:hypothetical protein